MKVKIEDVFLTFESFDDLDKRGLLVYLRERIGSEEFDKCFKEYADLDKVRNVDSIQS